MVTSFYPALLEPGSSGAYGVIFPDFPGCVSAGNTIDEAIAMGVEALASHVSLMQEDGDEIPEPGSFDRLPDWLTDEPEIVGSIDRSLRVLIPLQLDLVRVRVDVSLARGFLARIDQAVTARGMNRSAFLAEGARLLMRQPALENPTPGRAKAVA